MNDPNSIQRHVCHFKSVSPRGFTPARSAGTPCGNLSRLVERRRYAAIGVQKDLMRHANIATTANVYGAGVVDVMRQFNSQVIRRVIQ